MSQQAGLPLGVTDTAVDTASFFCRDPCFPHHTSFQDYCQD